MAERMKMSDFMFIAMLVVVAGLAFWNFTSPPVPIVSHREIACPKSGPYMTFVGTVEHGRKAYWWERTKDEWVTTHIEKVRECSQIKIRPSQ